MAGTLAVIISSQIFASPNPKECEHPAQGFLPISCQHRRGWERVVSSSLVSMLVKVALEAMGWPC